ncbi:uncharacterized protein LOC131641883 [Vicia villosa]|uniref:uncharacterized protein LOC131641883 n=1 Tax=Vicia villosa TaxID=3911 RepID=UPI00273AA594|nr:uncharacterized protein LOC131641883 [Vicia villosa]
MVAGRSDDAIVDALRMLVGSLGQIPQVNVGNRNGDDDEYRALGKFQRKNSPIFEGEHEPDKAQAWVKAIEKIFRVMNYTDAQRVQFSTHMLEKEAKDWWGNTAQRFEEEGNGTLVEYAAKFQELIKYCPHYNTMNAERLKCLKFVNGLRQDIKKAIGYQQITCFAELVNNIRIYNEDSRESASHYNALNDKKGQYRRKPYDDKKKKAVYDGKSSGGGTGASVKCFNCGVEGNHVVDCPKGGVTCFKCGKVGYKAKKCGVGSSVTCYNYVNVRVLYNDVKSTLLIVHHSS